MAVAGASFKHSVLQGFFWQGTGTIIGQVISAVSMIIVVRLLSPSDYGLMAMAGAFLTFLTVISELGIGGGLIQAKELTERQIRQIFGWILSTGLIGFFACYALAPWVARFYSAPDLVAILRILSISILLEMLYLIPRSMLIREMNFKAKAQIEVVALFGSALLTLVLAWNGFGVWSLVWSQLAMGLGKTIAYFIVRPAWIVPLFEVRGAEELLRFCVTVTGDRLLTFVYSESDTIIVGRFLGMNVLGVYNMAKTLSSLPFDRVMPIITQVSFSSYARIQEDLERVRRNLLRVTHIVALGGFPLSFGMAAVAPLGLPMMLGSKWEAIVVPFQLLCLILPLKGLTPALSPAVFAIGRPGVNLINMIIASSAMALALLAGVLYGVMGVCVAWVAAYPVVFGVTTIRSLRVLDLPIARYLAEVRFPFFASTLMLVLVWLVGRVFVTSQPLYSLILQIVAGLVCYLGLVLIFQREQYAEIRNFLRG